jgi:diguanylate cyclase (GGDEF)-like protein/PAS domain S-box-containing protein
MPHDDGFYRAMVDGLYDAVYFVDTDRKITYWNRSAEKLTGYKSRDVVGKHCNDNILDHVDIEGTNLCTGDCPLAKTIRDGKKRQAEVFLRHREGHRIPIITHIAPVRGDNGRIVGAVEVFADNSACMARRERVQELERMAMLDELTGLANRRWLEYELQTRLNELERYGRLFGVLFIDIDGLGDINREHGREVGDDVVRMIGQTLLYNSRPFDTMGRWEGGKFFGTIVNVDRQELAAAAHRFLMLIGTSRLPLEKGEILVTASIGATLAKWGDTSEELLAAAEGMLRQSKRTGRNRVVVGG